MHQFLSDATRILTSSTHPANTLQRLARAAVPGLGDFCLIFVLHGSEVRCAASAHATREGESLLRDLSRVYRITLDDPVSTVARAMRLGRPQLRSTIAAENHQAPRHPVSALHQRLACRSALAVPIGDAPRVVGAISLGYSASARRYATQDILPVRRLAGRIGVFLRDRPGAAPAAPALPIGRRQVPLRARL